MFFAGGYMIAILCRPSMNTLLLAKRNDRTIPGLVKSIQCKRWTPSLLAHCSRTMLFAAAIFQSHHLSVSRASRSRLFFKSPPPSITASKKPHLSKRAPGLRMSKCEVSFEQPMTGTHEIFEVR
jgi:hypothetical protein